MKFDWKVADIELDVVLDRRIVIQKVSIRIFIFFPSKGKKGN